MIDLLKKELKPAKDVLGSNGPGLTPLQIREGLDSIVQTLDLLVSGLEAFAANEQRKIVQVPMDTPLLPPEPGLTPNPASSAPTELNPSPIPPISPLPD